MGGIWGYVIDISPPNQAMQVTYLLRWHQTSHHLISGRPAGRLADGSGDLETKRTLPRSSNFRQCALRLRFPFFPPL